MTTTGTTIARPRPVSHKRFGTAERTQRTASYSRSAAQSYPRNKTTRETSFRRGREGSETIRNLQKQTAQGRGRVGSQRVISVRGRRVAVKANSARRIAKTTVLALLMIVPIICAAMYLSGVTTEQSFELQRATDEELTLKNEVETLHRDVARKESTSYISAEASRLGMVVPQEAGVLMSTPEGVQELRAAEPDKTRPVTDINEGSSSFRARQKKESPTVNKPQENQDNHADQANHEAQNGQNNQNAQVAETQAAPPMQVIAEEQPSVPEPGSVPPSTGALPYSE